MEEKVPSFLVKDIIVKDTKRKLRPIRTISMTHEEMYGHTDEAIKGSLFDSGLNIVQRDHIASSIMRGEYSVSSNSNSNTDTMTTNQTYSESSKSKSRRNIRRYNYNPTSLGVVSSSAPLLEPENKKAKEIIRCKKLGKGVTEFRFGPKVVPAVDRHVPRAQTAEIMKTKVGLESSSRCETIASMKTEMVKKNVAQVKELRDIVHNYQEQYSTTRRKNIQYRRKVNAFRQKLFERLREKRDPQIRDIMRILDDFTIDQFIERFKGCSMTVDAVISHIGDTLPVQHSNGCVDSISSTSNSVLSDDILGPAGDIGAFQFNESVYEFDDMESRDSISVDDVSRFKKQPTSRVSSSSPKKHKVSAFGNSERTGDPFLILNPRPIISRGAGFRSINTAARTSSPATDESLSKKETPQSMSVSTAPASTQRPNSPGGFFSTQPHYESGYNSEINDSRPCSPPTMYFMNAVKSELEANGNLQSEQATAVLDNEEGSEFDGHQKSIESLADSLSSSSVSSKLRCFSTKEKKGSPRKLGRVAAGRRKPPKVKTVPVVLDGNLDCTPVPYSQHIISPSHSGNHVSRERPKREGIRHGPSCSLPLSSTSYGDLYVVSSYKNSTDPIVINNL